MMHPKNTDHPQCCAATNTVPQELCALKRVGLALLLLSVACTPGEGFLSCLRTQPIE